MGALEDDFSLGKGGHLPLLYDYGRKGPNFGNFLIFFVGSGASFPQATYLQLYQFDDGRGTERVKRKRLIGGFLTRHWPVAEDFRRGSHRNVQPV